MSDTKRIGVEVDEKLWQEFREDVKQRKGRTSGVLASELENAIRQYIYTGENRDSADLLREIEERTRRIENRVGGVNGDGGATPSEPETHTHAPPETTADVVTDKPASNAATDKKVAYLAAEVRDRVAGGRDKDFREVPADVLREVVKEEYGFRADTAKRYVDRLREHFGLVEHPTADPLLVTPARREELLQTDADDTFAEVADAE